MTSQMPAKAPIKERGPTLLNLPRWPGLCGLLLVAILVRPESDARDLSRTTRGILPPSGRAWDVRDYYERLLRARVLEAYRAPLAGIEPPRRELGPCVFEGQPRPGDRSGLPAEVL